MSGADNQQERLVRVGWVVGFVDGEGCFSLGLVKQTGGKGRSGYKFGYQVFHEFAVTQGGRSMQCLEELQDFFGVGRVFRNRRHDDHREDLYRYVVRPRRDLVEVVIPFFQTFALRSDKDRDFQKFAYCVDMMQRGDHLSREGLLEIATVIETMNRRKPRGELIRILRGHTPVSV